MKSYIKTLSIVIASLTAAITLDLCAAEQPVGGLHSLFVYDDFGDAQAEKLTFHSSGAMWSAVNGKAAAPSKPTVRFRSDRRREKG